MSPSVSTWSAVPPCVCLFGALLLAGCSGSFEPQTVAPEQTPVGEISGAVHGGQSPVTGAQVYLFQPGTSGYASAATSIVTSGKSGVSCNTSGSLAGDCYVTTDPNGNFTLASDYTCTAGSPVYMVAVGGNPGLTGTVNNTAIVQMAGLGICPTGGSMATQVPYIVIDEVTTVAFAYAMSGFGTDAFHIGSPNTTLAQTGIANAMANSTNIVTVATGLALSTAKGNSNSTAPQAKINTLADIVATCVNTSSSTSSFCNSFFSDAKNSAGTQPTDESTALFNIAHNPTANVGALYGLYPSTPVFGPALGSTPTDWTMPVIYKGVISTPVTSGGTITSGPYNVAFDASGNAWIGDRTIGVVEIGPQGAVTTYSNASMGFKMVKGVAVSPLDGSIWISDFGNNDVYVMSSAGVKLTTITKDMNGPVLTGFALNPSGGNYLAHVATENLTGIVAFDSGTWALDHYADRTSYTNVTQPGWLAVDNTGSAWIPSTGTSYVGGLAVSYKSGAMKYTASEPNVGATYTTVPEALGISADSAGNVWAASSTGGTAAYSANAGTVTGVYTGGGMNNPFKTFVDGNNVVWIANQGANSVSALISSSGNWLSGSGFSTSAASGTGCVAIGVDPSGDVWTGNSDQSVTELLGLATPTAAPLYAGSTVTVGTTSTVTKGNLGTTP